MVIDRKFYWFLVISTIFILPPFLFDAIALAKFSVTLAISAYLMIRVSKLGITFRDLWQDRFVTLLVVLLTIHFLAAIVSINPSLAFFGYQGRYTGSAVMIGILAFTFYAVFICNNLDFTLLRALETSSIAVSTYFLLQVIGLDLFAWENYYDKPNSFLGNPNFVSSFVASGLTVTTLQFLSASGKFSKNLLYFAKVRKSLALASIFFLVQTGTIIVNGSLQGYVTYFVGLASIILLLSKRVFTRDFRRNISALLVISIFACIVFQDKLRFIAELQEIRARLFFWVVSSRVLSDNLVFGLGNSSFLDFYFREARTGVDLEQFGQLIASNPDSAHNFILDLGLTGGVSLIVVYLSINFIALKRAFQMREKSELQNGTLAVFLTFQIPALINPVPIHSLIWMFVILASFARSGRPIYKQSREKSSNKGQKGGFTISNSSNITSWSMKFAGLVAICGAWLPVATDVSFKESIYSQQVDRISAAALKWPTNPDRTFFATRVMCANQRPALARKVSKFALERNPRDFEAWVLLLRQELSLAQKAKIEEILSNLDPYQLQSNPGFTEEASRFPDCVFEYSDINEWGNLSNWP